LTTYLDSGDRLVPKCSRKDRCSGMSQERCGSGMRIDDPSPDIHRRLRTLASVRERILPCNRTRNLLPH